jgi:hypothetical protein
MSFLMGLSVSVCGVGDAGVMRVSEYQRLFPGGRSHVGSEQGPEKETDFSYHEFRKAGKKRRQVAWEGLPGQGPGEKAGLMAGRDVVCGYLPLLPGPKGEWVRDMEC